MMKKLEKVRVKQNLSRMQDLRQNYGRGFFFSFLVHAFLISLLWISIQSDSGSMKSISVSVVTEAKPDIVQAAMIDDKLVQAEMQRLEVQEKQQKAEIQKASEARREREKEQAKLQHLKKELAAAKQEEESRLAEIKLAKEKEKKQLEHLRLEKEKAQKRLAALDERRQEEQDRAEELRMNREQEERKQQDQEKKRVGDQKREAQKNEALRSAQRQQFFNSELARFQSLMRDRVNQFWIRAPGLPAGLACMLEIRLLPSGTVAHVHVINSSGNPAFDQSAELAVQKASPLPVPEDPELMEKFRHFTFEFKPPEVM